MSVLLSVCPMDLENGVSKMPTNHMKLLGIIEKEI